MLKMVTVLVRWDLLLNQICMYLNNKKYINTRLLNKKWIDTLYCKRLHLWCQTDLSNRIGIEIWKLGVFKEKLLSMIKHKKLEEKWGVGMIEWLIIQELKRGTFHIFYHSDYNKRQVESEQRANSLRLPRQQMCY